MKNKIMWLRISYWAGAIGDFAIAVLALIPKRMGVQSYAYPMGLLSAVAFSWGIILILADREPVARKWILLPTIVVGTLLLIAGIYSISAGAISTRSYIPNFILFPTMITLWSFSYFNARDTDI